MKAPYLKKNSKFDEVVTILNKFVCIPRTDVTKIMTSISLKVYTRT